MIKEENLPERWKIKPFSDCVVKATSPAKFKVQKKDYKEEGDYAIVDQSIDYIAGYTNDSTKVFNEQLPVVIFGDHTRIFKYVDFPFALGADGAKILIPKKNILDVKYFYFFLQGLVIEDHGYDRHYKYLKEKLIVVPPLETQNKIVEILERAEKLKEWRTEADELTDEFLKSIFLDMFGDPVNNPHNFKVGKIKDLIIKTQYGTSKKANEDQAGVPILRMNNITYEGYWDLSSLKYVELDKKEMGKYLVKNGELLFNRTNSRELVGKSAVYKEKEPMAFAGYLVKLITDSPETSEFIAGHLNSPYGKAFLFNMAKNIIGMANINAKEVQRIPILIPPTELRKQYAGIVEVVEEIKKVQKQSKLEINDLFNNLIQRAFKGELVC